MKILKVVANGFKMCSDNFAITFVPSANKTADDKEFELHEIDEELFVFKTISIIGKNASGKTTAMKLLYLVYDIISNFRIKNSINLFRYIDNVINLDITFFHEGVIYRYLTDIKVDDSSLNNENVIFLNQKLFKRDYKKNHSRNIFDYDKFVEVKFEIKLLLDTSILVNLLESTRYRGIFCSSEDDIYKEYSSAFNLYKVMDKNYKIVESIIKIFDEHIDSIQMIDENKFRIIHKNNFDKVVNEIELFDILSSGTTKGIGLFTYVVFSLKTGCDLVVDEIENHFHKTLVENLLSLYKDSSVNKKNASLIFTTHYCELLDLFNRSDNIYITKFEKFIKMENMYLDYSFRPELSKSKKFYQNAFNTDVDYESLMNFKKELM